jgi:hypothetical protein
VLCAGGIRSSAFESSFGRVQWTTERLLLGENLCTGYPVMTAAEVKFLAAAAEVVDRTGLNYRDEFDIRRKA